METNSHKEKSDEKKKIIQIIFTSIIIGAIISFSYFVLGYNYLTINLLFFCVAMFLNMWFYKRNIIKDTAFFSTLIVNITLIVGVILQGLRAGGLIFFIVFYLALPFIVDNSNSFKKKLVIYYLITTLSFLISVFYAPTISNWELITTQKYEALFLINTISAMLMALLFSYKGVLFTRNYLLALLKQKEEVEKLNNQLLYKSEELQNLNEQLQLQSEELQSQSEELQSQSEELQSQSDDLFLTNEKLQIER